MKFTFEVPEPLQRSVPVSYYENILSEYRYRDISFLKMDTTGQVLGKCEIGGINYAIKSYETAGLITSIEILDARETDSFNVTAKTQAQPCVTIGCTPLGRLRFLSRG
ncbi:hypothetical protein HMPREF2996_11625 [Corynebacterium sp. HMSC066C02]|nr:hypothetical protein HMPREF2996_11625 [Corynebacterium sp. HMSC066C02]